MQQVMPSRRAAQLWVGQGPRGDGTAAKLKVGILHPGKMGMSLAVSAQHTGHTVYWASEGRSSQEALAMPSRRMSTGTASRTSWVAPSWESTTVWRCGAIV